MDPTPDLPPPVPEPVPAAIAGPPLWQRLKRHATPLVLATTGGAVLLAALWIDSRHRIGQLEQQLGKRLGEAGADIRESKAFSGKAQEDVRTALVKLGSLEGKLAESQGQQLALEGLYQELSRNRDEWVMAELEQILLMANEQLQLSGNVRAALIALQTADSRLARVDKPQLIPVRKAVTRDIERLQALPGIDAVGMTLKLDHLAASVEQLPLLFGNESLPEKRPLAKPAQPESSWQRLSREVWGDFTSLVRIRKLEKGEGGLLAPSQEYFLRENLRLRLLAARIALLQHNEASFRADIKAADEWLGRHFDTQAKPVQAAQASLRQMAAAPVRIELPDISASLSAVRNFRFARERGGR